MPIASVQRTSPFSNGPPNYFLLRLKEKIGAEGLSKGPFQQEGKLIVGSKDVKSFYPEMDVELAAEEAKKEIEESILEIEEDTQELALFLACSMSQPK